MDLDDVLAKNRLLKNIQAGKRCFIIGNGPSIKTHDITPLKEEVTIVVSSFFRHDDAKTINPNYWVMADPYIWVKPEEYFLPSFRFAYDKGITTKLFIPTGGFPFFSSFHSGPFIDIHFFHYDHSKTIDTLIDFSVGIPPYGQNVVIVSLMLALYLGCNPIYFIGCDHDFMNFTEEEYENNVVDHFYSNPNQNKCSEHLTWQQWSAAMSRMRFEYEQLKSYASLWGFHVFNATKGGSLDIFPRIGYETLLLKHTNKSLTDKTIIDISGVSNSIGGVVIKMLNSGDNSTALVLIDEAIRKNINKQNRVKGLEYLKSICLSRFSRYGEALLFARQDYESNTANRNKSKELISQLEKVCGA